VFFAADQTFGPYRLLRRLGRGGFAEVWLAEQTGAAGFRRHVALKLVVVDPEGDGMRAQSLLREARICSWLDSEYVVAVDRILRDGDTILLAMEYCDAGTVTELWNRLTARGVPMPISVALQIGIACARALEAAHGARDPEGRPLCVVHRDLKPSNVLLSRAGAVKVCDFGIAKASDETNITGTGLLKGTTAYLAPELWDDVRSFSPASDAFALGTLLVESLTLRRLHAGGSMALVFKRITTGSADDDAALVAPHFPPLVPLLTELLQRDPARRTSDAGAIADRLEELLSLHGSGHSLADALRLLDALDDESEAPWTGAVDQSWAPLVERATGQATALVPGPLGVEGTWTVAWPPAPEQPARPLPGAEADLSELSLGLPIDLTRAPPPPPPEDDGVPRETRPWMGVPLGLRGDLPTKKMNRSTALLAPIESEPPAGAPAPSGTLQGKRRPRPRRPQQRDDRVLKGLLVALALALFALISVFATALWRESAQAPQGAAPAAGGSNPILDELVELDSPAAAGERVEIRAVAQDAPLNEPPAVAAAETKSVPASVPPAVDLPTVDPVAADGASGELAERSSAPGRASGQQAPPNLATPPPAAVRSTPTAATATAPTATPAPSEPAAEAVEPSEPAAAAVAPPPCLAASSRPPGAWIWLDGRRLDGRARSQPSVVLPRGNGSLRVGMGLTPSEPATTMPVRLPSTGAALVHCDLLGTPSCRVEPSNLPCR